MYFKKTVLLICGMIILSSSVVSIEACASELSLPAVSSNQITSKTIDLDFYKQLPYFSVTTETDGTFTVQLDESKLKEYCEENDLPLPEPAFFRGEGTTKITGNVWSGSCKVYIKREHLSWLAATGTSGIGLIFGGLPGFVVGSLIRLIYPANYKHGRVFVYSGYQYQYWYYQ